MRVLLVDDEPLALRRLEIAFADIEGVEVVGAADDGESALEAIGALKPDLVMLDVQMPGKSGMAVAAALPADRRPEIVFLTAFEHYAADAFDVEAADYLLKPVRLDRLRQAVARARRRRDEREALARLEGLEAAPAAEVEPAGDYLAWFEVQGPRGLRRVPVEAVVWIEAAKDYVLLHTESRSHLLRATMAELEDGLDPRQMLRVHRSAFVRPAAVRRVRRPGKGALTLVLDEGVEVQVGPNYAREVRAALEAIPED